MKRTLVRPRAAVAIVIALFCGALIVAPQAQAETVPDYNTIRSWCYNIKDMINKERAAHGLPGLVMNGNLGRAAQYHNNYMAKYNTLSHQLSGEMSLGSRITAYGYSWTALGENVGYSSNWTLAAAQAVHSMMYNEPANGPHRMNILNAKYHNVGVNIVIDTAHHRLWITEDYAAPR